MSSSYYLELVDELEAYKMHLSRITSMILLNSPDYSVSMVEDDKSRMSLILKSAERSGRITDEEYKMLKMQKRTIEMNLISNIEVYIRE